MKKWFKNFKSKFKIVIIHPETFEEKGVFNLSQMKFINVVIFYTLIIIALTTCLIFFTSLRELIPGYTGNTLQRQIYNIERRADSIDIVFRQEQQYIENIKRIIYDDNIDPKSSQEIVFINPSDTYIVSNNLDMPMFFVPVSNGLITNHFNAHNKHYGVDVVANVDAVIKATADGTVMFSDWSYEGGYVIGIQHDKNVVSVYKHNAAILCREGDVVKAGDAIAILGGGGSTSTGPHLHFELWYKGIALDPENYISFEGK